jgi:hypothetical protein
LQLVYSNIHWKVKGGTGHFTTLALELSKNALAFKTFLLFRVPVNLNNGIPVIASFVELFLSIYSNASLKRLSLNPPTQTQSKSL